MNESEIPFEKGAHLSAQKGELWLLQLDGAGEVRTASCSEGLQTLPMGRLIFQGEGIHTLTTDHHIVGGYRLWPESASSGLGTP